MTRQVLLQGCIGLAISSALFAQAGGRGTPGAGVATPTPSPGRTTTNNPNTTTQPSNTQNTIPDFQRPIYLSGKVVLDDGTPPSESVVMQISCSGSPRSIGYTDTKGRFNIDLGNRNNAAAMADASQNGLGGGPFGNSGGGGGFGGSSRNASSTGMGNQGAFGERNLMGCDLLASLPGFRSDHVNLGNRRSLDNPEVGTIVLHRLGNVQGYTISATTAMAPKDARKAYEKGHDEAKKGKWENAEKQFQKAVDSYPKYAVAWYELGFAQQQQKNLEGARKSYEQALAADSKLVSPYQQLALMAAAENKWDEVATDTDRLVRLNPIDFPQAWFYNALANYHLQKLDVAEKAAREGVNVDSDHRIVKMEQLLGVILYERQDYAGAAQHFKLYLKNAPEASDAENVKKQVAELEKALTPQAAKQ